MARTYKFIRKNTMVKVIDPEDYRKNAMSSNLKVYLEISFRSYGSKEWKKKLGTFIPRAIFKQIGIKMHENDKKNVGSGEICLLEYD